MAIAVNDSGASTLERRHPLGEPRFPLAEPRHPQVEPRLSARATARPPQASTAAAEPRRAHQPRIGLLAEPRYLAQRQPRGLEAALCDGGCEVRRIDVGAYEVGTVREFAGLDLVVARGRSRTVLGLLAWAEKLGVPVINSPAAIAAVHDKADMAMRLFAAGLPTPRSFVGRTAELAGRIPERCYPLVLKPMFGDNGRGLRIVSSRSELASLDWPDETALAQAYVANDGYDLKLYGIGDQLWVVRKPSPLPVPGAGSAALAEPELVPLSGEFAELGRRCARLFGLQFYGVDCVRTPAGPVVIEVNDFPNYTGVPGADQALAAQVLRHAQRPARRLK